MSQNQNEQPKNELRDTIRQKYADIATGQRIVGGTCCDSDQSDTDVTMIGDAYQGVAGYVADADLGLGCGLPVEHAGIRPGHVVLDLGSGAGLDAFVARREVGDAGRVIGVDMTAEMVAKSRENVEKTGFDNVEFRLGEIEHLPVDPHSIDVVISNCVLNLVPDKTRAFAEVFRVLRPGGHFCISDIVTSEPLPDWTAKAIDLYVGCVAGAMVEKDYLGVIASAGFEAVKIRTSRRIDIPGEVIDKYARAQQLAEVKAGDLHVTSITVTGVKPPRGTR
ncbi:MAG: arsenite methyltransferase [Rhodobacteraceae bacterium]|nr:arsenite methyltransferase [Paracoccaceae bacterium]